MSMDFTPRYAPESVLIAGKGLRVVQTYATYPEGKHPPESPLKPDCVALELRTQDGSRWYGFQKAWINSELRMVVQGFDARDEVRRHWQACKVF